MLEKPDTPNEKIAHCLQNDYGLPVHEVTFLPLGADYNTAVFHILTTNNQPYFLKLRSGNFDPTSVRLPQFLHEQGLSQIIPILPTQTGALWGNLDDDTTILYPFINGRNGYESKLTNAQWQEFGQTLKKIHTSPYPPDLLSLIQKETYPPQAREAVKQFLNQSKTTKYSDPVAQEVATLLQSEHATITNLINRAEQLAQALQNNPPEMIVCHSDLHAGNIFLTPDGKLYLVDWDQPIRAPKERDLMYIGSGLMASGLTLQEEEVLFYEGYGRTSINPTALAYYRYERIIQDIYEYCKELLLSEEGGTDRAQSLIYLKSNFLPNSTMDIAYQSDKTREEI